MELTLAQDESQKLLLNQNVSSKPPDEDPRPGFQRAHASFPQLWDRIQVLGAAVPQARGAQLRNTEVHLPASAEATSPGSADRLMATPKHDHCQPHVRL